MSNGHDPSIRKLPGNGQGGAAAAGNLAGGIGYALGVSFATVNRGDNGRAKPSPLALEKIESLLRSLGDKGKALHKAYFEKEA